MALVNVPWATGNGALNSVELARADSYIGSKGETGVCSPDHMQVSALPTPGSAVRVSRGVVVMENRYPNVFGQSYVAMETDSTDVPIPATGSTGGATRYVIVRVDDPTQGGQQPADPATGPYNRYAVVSNINGLSYPHAVLARINQPANTATITAGMITDMRAIAMPREKTVRISRPILNSDDVEASMVLQHRHNASNIRGELWPDETTGANYFLIRKVPDWARYCRIRWWYSNVDMTGELQWGGVFARMHWFDTDPGNYSSTQDFGYRSPSIPNYPAPADTLHFRTNILGSDVVTVPTAARGLSANVSLHGWVAPTSPNAGVVSLRGDSGIDVEVTFFESNPDATSGMTL